MYIKFFKNTFEENHYFSNSFTRIFKDSDYNCRATSIYYITKFFNTNFCRILFNGCFCKQKMYSRRNEIIAKQKVMFREQRKRKIGKNISSSHLVKVVVINRWKNIFSEIFYFVFVTLSSNTIWSYSKATASVTSVSSQNDCGGLFCNETTIRF